MEEVFEEERKRQRRCKPLNRPDLNELGRLRIGHLMAVYDLSHSSIVKHLNKGLIPPADGVIAGRRYWKTATIKADLLK